MREPVSISAWPIKASYIISERAMSGPTPARATNPTMYIPTFLLLAWCCIIITLCIVVPPLARKLHGTLGAKMPPPEQLGSVRVARLLHLQLIADLDRTLSTPDLAGVKGF